MFNNTILFKFHNKFISNEDYFVQGSGTDTETVNFIEPAFISERPVYTMQSQCSSNSNKSVNVSIQNVTINTAGINYKAFAHIFFKCIVVIFTKVQT